jgi:signal transduction histidine kinase
MGVEGNRPSIVDHQSEIGTGRACGAPLSFLVMRQASSPARLRAPALLPVLFAAILLLAAGIAYEAVSALRQREAVAARTLRDYAAFAAWELAAKTGDAMTSAIREVLDPAAGSPAASPYDQLPPLEPVANAVRTALPCAEPAEDGTLALRLDLRDGSLLTLGAVSPGLRAWLADTLRADATSSYRPDQRYAVIDRIPGQPGRVLVYAVKRGQYGAFAQPGAPIGVFGFVRCRSAFGVPLLRRVIASRPLLPSQVSGGLPNDSALAISVYDSAGTMRFRTSTDGVSELRHEVPLETPARLRVRIALQSAAVARMAVIPPGGSVRLPWLIVLLAVTAGLALVGVLQLRREQELGRLRYDFTSSVSHELRTPLAQILLSGETLALGRARGEGERQAAAAVIVQEARRLIRMVENVLSFARLERGGPAVEPQPTRVAPLLRAILTPWLQTVEGRARLATGFDESLWARVDPGALTQVLHNLLDNAVKYGPAGQTIGVSLAREGSQVRIAVEDQGPGVSSGDRDRIWEPFVRSAPGRAAGTGLGLAVVRELVEAHGGWARVESSAGGGARFVVLLPACEPAPPADATPTTAEAVAPGR